jgi:hypothetical protein
MYKPEVIMKLKAHIRIYVLRFLACTILAGITGPDLFSQNSVLVPGEEYKESVILNTDRDIYITGENVWFNVIIINSATKAPVNLSKVVYVEFLDKNNFPLKQLKVSIENCTGSSVFTVPENLLSGNYIIRAYSSWMQNWPPELFCHKTISVINPFGDIEALFLKPSALQPVHGTNSPIAENLVNRVPEDPKKGIQYQIVLNKNEYGAKEKVTIEILSTDFSGIPLETDFSVSVAKSGIVNAKKEDAAHGSFAPAGKVFIPVKTIPEYVPEIEGHIICGVIKLKETGEPLKNSGLSLSFVGKVARCQFSGTNDKGEFYFVVREPGISEIVIQPVNPDIPGYYVDLKQPFNSTFSNFQPTGFSIDSSSLEAINNAVISMQINHLYEPYRQKIPEKQNFAIPDFFGKPENTILMSDYIELSSLREVVKEIIPNVYTLKQNGKHELKLINKLKSLPFENKPLVLIDGVPIYDFEKVLVINSKEIEKADVINKRYFFSENVFDGILSFTTKKGNLSVMEFDNTIFRQVYEACQTAKTFYSPDYSTDLLKESRIPDYRNTLYWNPEIHTTKDGKAYVELYTSDESSEYIIVIQGMAEDGKTGYSTAVLKVN